MLQLSRRQPPPQLSGLLHQRHRIPLHRQIRRRLNPRDPAADDQRRPCHRHPPLVQRLQVPRPRHAHPQERPRLLLRRRPLPRVHPRTLVPYVHHLQQVWIETHPLTRLPEDRLVRARRTRGHHDPVQIVLADQLRQLLLSRRRAREQIAPRHRHPRQALRILRQILHIQNPRDVHPAVAHQHPHPRRTRQVQRLNLALLLFRPVPGQKQLRPRRRRRRLRHAVRDHLRPHRAAAHQNPLPRGLHGRNRRVPPGDEPIAIRLDPQHPRQLHGPVVRCRRHREHYQIGGNPHLLVRQRVLDEHHQRIILGHLLNLRRPAPHVRCALLVPRPLHEVVESLPKGPQVRVEDGHVFHVGIVLPHQHRVLYRVHTAKPAAIRPPAFAPRPDALHEHDPLGRLHVRRPHHVPLRHARRVEHPLQFQARDHVRETPVAIVPQLARIELLKPDRHQDRPRVDRVLLRPHVEVDRIDVAGAHTVLADQQIARPRCRPPLALRHCRLPIDD